MGSKKKTNPKSLSAGRPPSAKSSRSMSRRASRSLINKHHQLEKQRLQAVARADNGAASKLALDIAALGGIDRYQAASLQGQSTDRGGDTSKVLLQWLDIPELKDSKRSLKLLEVGSLSTLNACSKSGLFDAVHIDLNSQEPGILQQDFMQRPIPTSETEKFDVISLSLVLNFVSDAAGRGDMLQRTLSFLKSTTADVSASTSPLFPCLFVVLPRSCVDNSRYFTLTRFEELMGLLGYTKVAEKSTQKLAYSLWRRDYMLQPRELRFPKVEVNPGRSRNNFAMALSTSVET